MNLQLIQRQILTFIKLFSGELCVQIFLTRDNTFLNTAKLVIDYRLEQV